MAPSSNRRASGTRSEASGATMASPSVVLCSVKPSDQQRAERDLAEREGGADGQPLAEVVQADADGDEQRHDAHAGLAPAPAAAPPRRRSQAPKPSMAR